MDVAPAVIDPHVNRKPAVGLQCAINF